MSKKDNILNVIITLITLIGVVAFIKHLISQTETRLFSDDAVKTLNNREELLKIEKELHPHN
jgi:hypothetical protein